MLQDAAGAETRQHQDAAIVADERPVNANVHIEHDPARVDLEHRAPELVGPPGGVVAERVELLEQLQGELVGGRQHHQRGFSAGRRRHRGRSVIAVGSGSQSDDVHRLPRARSPLNKRVRAAARPAPIAAVRVTR
ncbi:MAG TPA: hypothetical protein VGO80_11800 [Solirubrobacteraceae bacterium]|jgi:hypothetical protein|nr:hypothetical protein [Solirubrobacteraceae bacterium]